MALALVLVTDLAAVRGVIHRLRRPRIGRGAPGELAVRLRSDRAMADAVERQSKANSLYPKGRQGAIRGLQHAVTYFRSGLTRPGRVAPFELFWTPRSHPAAPCVMASTRSAGSGARAVAADPQATRQGGGGDVATHIACASHRRPTFCSRGDSRSVHTSPRALISRLRASLEAPSVCLLGAHIVRDLQHAEHRERGVSQRCGTPFATGTVTAC